MEQVNVTYTIYFWKRANRDDVSAGGEPVYLDPDFEPVNGIFSGAKEDPERLKQRALMNFLAGVIERGKGDATVAARLRQGLITAEVDVRSARPPAVFGPAPAAEDKRDPKKT